MERFGHRHGLVDWCKWQTWIIFCPCWKWFHVSFETKAGLPDCWYIFLEMVAILSAIHHVANFSRPPRQVLIYTDSLDSVAVFNTLSTSQPLHNSVPLRVAGIILWSGLDLHIRHIKGKKNIWADLLSQLLVDDYHLKFPADRVCMFGPPHELLPAW